LIERSEGGERVVLVHLLLHTKTNQTPDPEEFRELAISAGAKVVGDITSTRQTLDAKYCIGSGKVEEIKGLIAETKTDLVLFDHVLTPSQERNLERAFECRVLDRTGLILDIFAKRARTYEGKLQVELAQLKHHASRLIRGWTHLERQKGGIGLRGPGETQLEVDRRLIRGRIKHIQARLEKVRQQREQGRRARQKASLPTVSLVGYTNAGKSTLFNDLSGADVYVANQLFATLDPTLRTIELPAIGKVILADTVGFIRELPHNLVEAFRATLEETKEADLLLHIIDSQEETREARVQQVEAVLQEIGALAVPRIEVYNKIDLVPEKEPHLFLDENGNPVRVFISAKSGLGINLLKEAIVNRLGKDLIHREVCLSSNQFKERALLYDMGVVESEEVRDDGQVWLNIRVPRLIWEQRGLEAMFTELK
jgi:GTP-binding protein HflX